MKFRLIPLVCTVYTLHGMREWDGLSYHHNSSPQYHQALKFITTLAVKPHETILDLGCGTGRVTQEIARLVPQGSVLGVDISSSMIEVAKRESMADNISYAVCDAAKLSYDTAFDRIISTFALHWVHDQAIVFKHCARALKKGAVLNIAMGALTPHKTPGVVALARTLNREYWKDTLSAPEVKNHHFLLSSEKARAYSIDAQLTILSIEIIQQDLLLENKERFRYFIKAILEGAYPFIAALTEQDREHFLDDFIDEYQQLVSFAVDGSIIYPVQTLIIEAKKE